MGAEGAGPPGWGGLWDGGWGGFGVTLRPPTCGPPFQPEGSVLHDRFKSLQKRSLIEPRERAK